jgi:hypothetical protein
VESLLAGIGRCSALCTQLRSTNAPAAARLTCAAVTLQDVLRVAPHGHSSPAVATALAAAATHEPAAATLPPAMHPGVLPDCTAQRIASRCSPAAMLATHIHVGTIMTPSAMVGRGASAGGLTEEDIFAAVGPGGSDAFHDADSGVSNDGSSEQEASMMRTSTAGSNSLQVRKSVLPKMCT